MWRIAWLLLLAFNVSAEPFATAQIPDARATHCDYEDTTTGEAARVPVVVDTVRGLAANSYRVCRFDVAHWLPGSAHNARMRAVDTATGVAPSAWTAATLDRPAAATVTLALVGSAAPPPPPPPPDPEPGVTTKNEDFSGTLAEYTQLHGSSASITGGVLRGAGGAETGIFHSSGTYTNDQNSQIVVAGAVNGFRYYTAGVRYVYTAANNFTGYRGTIGGSGDYYLSRVTGGAGTDIVSGSIGRSLVAGDVILFTAAGTTLTLKLNGTTVNSFSDATYASGKPGIELFDDAGVDNAVFADISSGSTYNESVSETATASDATTGTRTRVGAVTEAATGTDAASALGVWLRAVSESASAVDANAGTLLRVGAISESGSAADAPTAALLRVGAVSEAASAADSQAATAALAAAAAEAASAADAVASVLVAVAAVSESGSATDAVAAGAASYDVTISEAGSAADAAAAIAVQVASLSEPLSAADAYTVTTVYGAALSEPGSAADATNWSGAEYSVDLTESASLADAVSAALQALASIAEAASAGDAPTIIISAGASLAEPAAAADALATALQITALLAEPASAADTVFVQPDGTIDVGIEEAASAMDEYVAVLIDGFLVITAPPRRTLTAGASRPANLSAAYRPRNLPGRGR